MTAPARGLPATGGTLSENAPRIPAATIAWPALAVIVILVGWVAGRIGGLEVRQLVWMAGLIVCAIPVVASTILDARRGHFATDIVATLAIVGAILLGSAAAGLVVVLMRQGGEALERYAEGRASAAVRELEAAAPRRAHRVDGARIVDLDASDVAVGDILLVRPGELVPCDAEVTEGSSDVDTSALTGEPLPVFARAGSALMSGSLNGTGVLRIRATARAAESQYARIVELVRTAQSHKAPMQRLADRVAVWFTPVTLVVCAIALLVSGDWDRVLAVLVVATPCPLILATPVAFVGGINRAARSRIVIRNGGALEALSRVSVVILDKTGTITLGEPRLERVRTTQGWDADQVLRLVASLEQGSSHRLARAVVGAAVERGITLAPASAQREEPGHGMAGVVDGHAIRLGARGFVLPSAIAELEALPGLESGPALLRTYVAIDGRLVASLEYAEELRAEVPELLAGIRGLGIRHVALLSGDHLANVRVMAARAGIADVRAELLPADKAAIVETYRREGDVVMMVGDGTNDAPALAAADVGVAMAGHGGGVTTEAADVIILRDSLSAVSQSLAIGRRTTRIARQSIGVGLGLSAGAMVWAAAGGIEPIAGAMLQEGIDVAVILNALRTIRGTS